MFHPSFCFPSIPISQHPFACWWSHIVMFRYMGCEHHKFTQNPVLKNHSWMLKRIFLKSSKCWSCVIWTPRVFYSMSHLRSMYAKNSLPIKPLKWNIYWFELWRWGKQLWWQVHIKSLYLNKVLGVFLDLFVVCVWIFADMYACAPQACWQRSELELRYGGCKLPCGSQEWNQSSLQKQQVL